MYQSAISRDHGYRRRRRARPPSRQRVDGPRCSQKHSRKPRRCQATSVSGLSGTTQCGQPIYRGRFCLRAVEKRNAAGRRLEPSFTGRTPSPLRPYVRRFSGPIPLSDWTRAGANYLPRPYDFRQGRM
jgi:hypothetical protein